MLLKLDSIGDYIIFRNFIRELKSSDQFKDFEITLCGNVWWKDIAEQLDNGIVSKFIWVDYASMADYEYRQQIYEQVHGARFEVLIHPTYSRCVVSDLIVKFSGVSNTVGFDGDMTNLPLNLKSIHDQFYSRLIPGGEKNMFEFFRYKLFFETLLGKTLENVRPEIDLVPNAENKIFICPGAKDDFRKWSAANFALLSEKLRSIFPDDEFFICGAASDSIAAKEIQGISAMPFIDLTGKIALTELIEKFRGARLIVTNDSGPLHIAAALGKRTVCISNGNNYGRFTPYPAEVNNKCSVIYPEALLKLSEEQRLRQYGKHGSTLDINSISVEEVFKSVKQLFTQHA